MADIDFTPCPAFEAVEVNQRRSVRTPTGSSVAHAHQVNERTLRRFLVPLKQLTAANRTTLRLLWRTAVSRVLPMNFTPRDGTPIEVCFDMPRLVIRHGKNGFATCDVELVEVR